MRVNGQSGFTLVEMIMVIVITGILGSMAAVFLRVPVQQYMDAGLRADLTDIADLALRRMANDIRTAVPSSVRVAGTDPIYLEFLLTKDGGRYRASAVGGTGSCGPAGDEFTPNVADTCFEILGPAITFSVNDVIVVGSTQAGVNPYADAVRGVWLAQSGATGQKVSAVIASGFTTPDPNQRFEVVPVDQKAVTYACSGPFGTLDVNQDGQGKLVRYWNYGINLAQPTPPSGGSSAVLANKLYTCSIVFDQSRGLLASTLQFTRASEVISLYQEIHIHSSPTIHVHNTP